MTLPRTAAEQYYAGIHVPLSSLRPGDLVFWASNEADPSTIYHVAIAVAGNEVVQAPYTGEVVEQVPIWGAGLVTLATRP